ncbi:hypothetical protein ILUMI_26763 [Ignelater luminosus]|uniref:Mutator-like transposase domain-containing protein n=1 Tax=Ignelater luminosus TaxID=2038154 RepID=A0A8K0C7F3_IGNLU|nr:hypothetical protein ILUMI_26763 [Ignelater luminosus]
MATKRTITAGTWNIQGLRTKQKKKETYNQLKTAITESAKEALGTGNKRPRYIEQFLEKLEDFIREKKKAYMKCAQQKSQSNTADMPCNSKSEVSKNENATNMLPVQEPENIDGIDAEVDDNGSENLSELEVVTDTINEEPLFAPTGRRLFDIGFLFQQILNGERHRPFDCSIIDMSVISESRHGLQSTFLLKCKNCGITKRISNENIEEIAASIDMPMMSDTTYQKFHESVSVTIRETAWKIMEEAGRMEAELAKELGEVDRDNVPCITVVTDGAWSKRSYSVNYDAASGVRVFIDTTDEMNNCFDSVLQYSDYRT